MERPLYLLALALLAGSASAQIVEPTPAPPSGNTANPTNIAYFSSVSGVDANPCTVLLPCQTQAKATSLLPAGGITIALKGGEHFYWEKFGQANHVTSTSTTTYATNPVLGQNVTVTSYGTGPYILEGADEIQSLPWTAFDSSTWVATYTAGTVIAESLYIDVKDQDSAGTGGLLRAPNGPVVTYAGAVYPQGSLVAVSTKNYVVSNIAATSTSPSVDLELWRQQISGGFSTTLTGIQNTQAVPGSYFNDIPNHKIYVHLADASSPAGHVVQATNRSEGILCESCNNWLVNNGIIEKYYYNGAAFVNYSGATSTNGYYTNIGNQIDNMKMWDNTSEIRWLYTGQSGANRLWRLFQAGIMMNGTNSAGSDGAATGTKITNSFFGRSGNPGGVSGDGTLGTVYITGMTAPEVGNNTVVPWTANGISVQSSSNIWVHDNNLEGQLRGCAICYSNNNGLMVERNTVGYGAGDAFQGGGVTTCTGTWDYSGHDDQDVPGANPCIVRYNNCHDYGIVGSALYNCYDTNTNAIVKNMLFDHNNGINSDSGVYTFEVNSGSIAGAGITDVTFRYNTAVQHKNYSVYTDRSGVQGIMNNSNTIYFANTTVPGQNGFFHSYKNIFQTGSQTTPVAKVGSFATFMKLVGDTTSIVVPNTSDPIFTDITNGVYTIKAGSPALNQPSGGLTLGALGLDFTPVYGARFSGVSFVAGQAAKQ